MERISNARRGPACFWLKRRRLVLGGICDTEGDAILNAKKGEAAIVAHWQLVLEKVGEDDDAIHALPSPTTSRPPVPRSGHGRSGVGEWVEYCEHRGFHTLAGKLPILVPERSAAGVERNVG